MPLQNNEPKLLSIPDFTLFCIYTKLIACYNFSCIIYERHQLQIVPFNQTHTAACFPTLFPLKC